MEKLKHERHDGTVSFEGVGNGNPSFRAEPRALPGSLEDFHLFKNRSWA